MSLITVYDYEEITDEGLYERLKKIEKEKCIILDQDRVDFESSNGISLVTHFLGKDKIGQYVGLIGDDQGSIIIGCRFDQSNEESNHYFLNYLLSQTFSKNRIFENMNPKSGFDSTLDILLTILFFHSINKAAKKGLFRQYRTYHRNDSRIRGSIDIARHVKENTLLNNGKIAYSFREYTIDNSINQLIYTTYLNARKKYPSLVNEMLKNQKNCKDIFKTFAREIEPIQEKQQIRKLIYQTRKKITHSVYKDWDLVRKIGILLLRRLGIRISEVATNEVKGILINMNYLFEEYLREITGGEKKSKEIIFDANNNSKRRIEMDLYWQGVNETRGKMVLDAKYKIGWKETFDRELEFNKGTWIERNDIFQVISYKYINECSKAGVVFPYQENEDNKEKYKDIYNKEKQDYPYAYSIREETVKDFYLFPLIIPDSKECSNYLRFQEMMKENESRMRDKIDQLNQNDH